MFIGREKELDALNGLYNSGKFEFVVLYGRRRVGKTELIKHFIEDKNAIYFTGVESNAKQNLENLSTSILEYISGIKDTEMFSVIFTYQKSTTTNRQRQTPHTTNKSVKW